MNKLVFRFIVIIAVFATIAAIAIGLSTSAPVSNEVALAQLNGGDEAYITMQAYNQYKNVAIAAGSIITTVSVVLIIAIIYKIFKEKNK